MNEENFVIDQERRKDPEHSEGPRALIDSEIELGIPFSRLCDSGLLEKFTKLFERSWNPSAYRMRSRRSAIRLGSLLCLGDSMHFDTAVPHKWRNSGDLPSKALFFGTISKPSDRATHTR